MKILSIDIETTPAIGYIWGLRDQNLGLEQVIQPSRVLCFAARFLGERKMHFHADWTDGHEAMVYAAWELLDEADVVMHYNGKRFDVEHLEREFLELDEAARRGGLEILGPPSPYKQLDLLNTTRRFRTMSHKLQYVTRNLGMAGKHEHEGFPLWAKAMSGDARARKVMERYNKQDVVLLEDLHEAVRPWIRDYPSVPLHDGVAGCPRCGAPEDKSQRRGTYKTRVSEYQQLQCQVCKGWWRRNKRLGGVTNQPL